MSKYKPGSMGAKEEKNTAAFRVAAFIVYALIVLFFLAIPSYPLDWARRAGTGWNIAGFVLIAVSYLVIWFGEDLMPRKSSASWVPSVLAFLLLVLGVAAFAGFDFSFIGIAERP